MKNATIRELFDLLPTDEQGKAQAILAAALEAQIVDVAMMLAHSDRAVYLGKRAEFRDGAARYWSVLYEPQKKRWMNLARALLTGDYTQQDEGSCIEREKKPIMPGMRASIKESAR